MCLTSHCFLRTDVWDGTFQSPSLASSTSPSPPGSAVSHDVKHIRTRAHHTSYAILNFFNRHCTHINFMEVIYEIIFFTPAGFISMVLNKLMKLSFPAVADGLPVVSFDILLDV